MLSRSRPIRSIDRARPVFLAALMLVLLPAIARPADGPIFPGPFDGLWSSDAFWTDDFAVPGLDGPVSVVEPFGGGLVVGGWFSQADGAESWSVARHDGQGWRAMPPAAEWAPSAMLVDKARAMRLAGLISIGT